MRWAELRMCRFWAGGISSFPFSRAREYRLLRRLSEAGSELIGADGRHVEWPHLRSEYYRFLLQNV